MEEQELQLVQLELELKKTISTQLMGAKELDVYLAWSLHSSIPKHRSEIMPINEKYSINTLIPQLKNIMIKQSYLFLLNGFA